ncbi:MAG: hypothetical protein HZA81_04175 [Candidatus Taylorbacteria bacterium]|nr:hypothetical protein [Candidatus Taylorbacteria bacterium]
MDFLKSLNEEFGWFIWGLLGLGLIWFFTGGANNPSAHEGQFIKPLAPLDTGEIYGDYYSGKPNYGKESLNLPESPAEAVRKAANVLEGFLAEAEEAKQVHITSLLAKGLYFDGIAGAKRDDPDEEYLRIVSSEHAKGKISLSGLVLRGVSLGSAAPLPRADELPILGTSAKKTDVILSPGGRALISSGRSPIGTSFRANICSGYLDQFQEYSPGLVAECPEPLAELALVGPALEAPCRDFIEKLPRCRIYQGRFPSDVSAACRSFVAESLNYNSCTLRHQKDAGFYKDEWRLFLDQEAEMWGNKNEIIRLLDPKGSTIDAITY